MSDKNEESIKEISARAEALKESFISYRKRILSLFTSFSALLKIEYNYIKSLRKLHETIPSMQSNDCLKDSFSYLQTHILNKCQIHSSFYEVLKDQLFPSIPPFIDLQIKKISELYNSVSLLEKNLSNSLSFVNAKKNLYSINMQKTESALYDHEMEKKAHLDVKKYKFDSIAESCLKTAKESEKGYMDEISKSNEALSSYTKQGEKFIQFYASMESDLRKFLLMMIDNYYKSCSSFYDNQKKNLETGIQISDKAKEEEKKELSEETSSLKQKLEALSPLEFEPYQISLLKKDKEKLADVHLNVIEKMKSNFENLGKNFNEKEDKEMKTFWNLTKLAIYLGEDMTKTEKKNLNSYLNSDRKYRKNFLYCLNNQRNSGRMEMSVKVINLVSKLLITIINKIEKENDYELAKFVIILSQTFYYIDKLSNERIYIQLLIMKQKMFLTKDFWLNFLVFSIDCGMKEEPQEKTKLEIDNIYLSQMAALINNMVEFNLGKSTIYEVIQEAKKKYNIEESIIEELKKIIDTSPVENKKMKEVKSTDALFKRKRINGNYDIAFMEKDDDIKENENEDD